MHGSQSPGKLGSPDFCFEGIQRRKAGLRIEVTRQEEKEVEENTYCEQD